MYNFESIRQLYLILINYIISQLFKEPRINYKT